MMSQLRTTLHLVAVRDKNTLKLSYSHNTIEQKYTHSQEYSLDGYHMIQIRIQKDEVVDDRYKGCSMEQYIYCLKFKNKAHQRHHHCTLKISSKEFNLNEITFQSDDTDWRELYTYPCQVSFVIYMEMDLTMSKAPFKHFFDEVTDFEISGEGGSISVHKAVIADYSPVVQRMLTNPCDFKEKVENKIISSASIKTLVHLKAYMYLQQLPEDGLEELAALASYYWITDLMTKCSIKLLFTLNDENMLSLLEFATHHKLNILTTGILSIVRMGMVNVKVDVDVDVDNSKIAEEIAKE